MTTRPYHMARQEHVGEMLDKLDALGHVQWRFDYDTKASRAIYHVTLSKGAPTTLDSRAAERLVQRICDERGIPWKPVPHPGGENQRRVVWHGSKRSGNVAASEGRATLGYTRGLNDNMPRRLGAL